MRINKKKSERFYIERFQECFDKVLSNLEDSESPDFLCNVDGERTGVEITHLKDKKLAEIVGHKNATIQRAAEIAIKENLPPVEVSVWLRDRVYLRKEIDAKAKYLYKLVETHLSNIADAKGYLYKLPIKKDNDIKQVSAHWNEINGKKWLFNHRWTNVEAGLVSWDFSLQLQQAINKKNAKYREYRKQCDKCWLLIVVDKATNDEKYAYKYMDKDITYNSSFDRIYFFDYLEKKYYPLLTDPISAAQTQIQ